MHVITGQKTTQEPPEGAVSAGKKTFKNLKLEHFRYNISLKLAHYVIILRPLIFTENRGCHSKGSSRRIKKNHKKC